MRIKDVRRTLSKNGDEHTEFYISNMDQTTDVKYYGFVGYDGYWVIMQWDTTTNIFLYAYGQEIATYSVNWDAAGLYVGALTFSTADEVF